MTNVRLSPAPMVLDAQKVHRVWGGNRFAVDEEGPVGEIWLVHEDNVIRHGPGTGTSLAEAVESMGEWLLGSRLTDREERRFPLLIKLIDAAEWLSIQVHPDDKCAIALEGPASRGKTEAWYALQAAPGSHIIAGVREDVTQDAFSHAVQHGGITEMVVRHKFGAGDAVTLPAGTVHALGPGAVIYEIQQSSDITYRVYDWDRLDSEGRFLHIDQSVQAADISQRATPNHVEDPPDGSLAVVADTQYFRLRLGHVDQQFIELSPAGEYFHILTAIEGESVLRGAGWRMELRLYDTVVIPASMEAYRIEAIAASRFLLATPE